MTLARKNAVAADMQRLIRLRNVFFFRADFADAIERNPRS